MMQCARVQQNSDPRYKLLFPERRFLLKVAAVAMIVLHNIVILHWAYYVGYFGHVNQRNQLEILMSSTVP